MGDGGQSGKIRVEVDKELADLIPNFLNNRKKEIDHIDNLLKSKDYETLCRVGHSMKGSCGGYGFMELSELGKSIEQAADGKDEKTLGELLNQYKNMLDRFEVVFV